ncbi:MAG TPA: non-homologous end-joining DNA ligase [Actinomycetota bacterium]|nr:non-homologous end-joining DNA ligase [Actinomycetota bacterium]
MPETRDYTDKRSFDRTPEPEASARGNLNPTTAKPGKTFLIHQHHARRLHFDLRLEMLREDGTPVLVSWAVPKGLPRKKGKPHLAIHVEDHPFDYGEFEGTIPAGNYGAGEVRIFDSGTYEVLEQEEAKLTIRLKGQRLRGVYHIIQTDKGKAKDEWLAFLREDERPTNEPLPPLKPMLATLGAEAFDDPDWIFEPKWDGVRSLTVCEETTAHFSRTQKEMTATYPELGKLHEQLVCLDAVLDGEIVAFEKGRPSFEKLQSRINLQNEHDIQRAMKAIPVTYIAFDLLYLDGRQVFGEKIEHRKELLEKLVVPNQYIQVSAIVPESGNALWDAAKESGLEGIVAKKLGSVYRPGKRTREWLKIKVVHDADVVIGGWSKGEGARATSFGSLLVGAYADDGLHFLGAVGTGFTQQTLNSLMPKLKELETDKCPFVEGAAGIKGGRFGKAIKNVSWTKPELVAMVEFRELTSANRLRAPSFKGLRDDKKPQECLLADLEAVRPGG